MVRKYCIEGKLKAKKGFNGQWQIETKQFLTNPKLIPYWENFKKQEEANLEFSKEIAKTMLEILKEDDEDEEKQF